MQWLPAWMLGPQKTIKNECRQSFSNSSTLEQQLVFIDFLQKGNIRRKT
jgi:hypothetical protein